MGPEPLSFLEVQTQTGWGRMLENFACWCSPQPGWFTLDVGCGPGLLPALLARQGCRAFGLDIDFTALSPLRLHPDLALGTNMHLPYPAHTFDLVTASNLLFILADPLTALIELLRVIRPTGRVAMINPSPAMSQAAASALADERRLDGLARRSLLHYAAQAEAHRRWSEAELAQLLAHAGLALEETTPRMGRGLVLFSLARPISKF